VGPRLDVGRAGLTSPGGGAGRQEAGAAAALAGPVDDDCKPGSRDVTHRRIGSRRQVVRDGRQILLEAGP